MAGHDPLVCTFSWRYQGQIAVTLFTFSLSENQDANITGYVL